MMGIGICIGLGFFDFVQMVERQPRTAPMNHDAVQYTQCL